MSRAYVVKRGDNLSLIARRHGLGSWQEIYFHDDNAGFRRRRPNPNLIFPGDLVMIPGDGPPAPPQPPSPPGQSALERDLETYLNQNKQNDPVAFVARQTALVMLSETHVGRARKATFLADVAGIQTVPAPPQAVFHASEHYPNDPASQVAIQNFVFASTAQLTRARLHLPAAVRPFEPVLEVARRAPGHRMAIIAADTPAKDEDARHGGIHASFNMSIARHNTLHSLNTISRRSRGNFLIGAFHGGRLHDNGGSTPTTSQLLLAEGWQLVVVRITVNVVGGDLPDGTIVGGENLEMEPLGGTGTPFDLLPILNRVAGGSPFFADLRLTGSPFAQIKGAGRANVAFNSLFDFILHLP